jgi:hypothetical protein
MMIVRILSPGLHSFLFPPRANSSRPAGTLNTYASCASQKSEDVNLCHIIGAHRAPLQSERVHCSCEILGHRRLESFPFSGARMLKAQFPGVQHLAWKIPCQLGRINFVTQQRMAEVMEMDPDLMRAAAMQPAFDQTCLFILTQNAVLRFRGPAAC